MTEALTPSQNIEHYLKFLREVEQIHRMAEKDEQEANDLTQDLLHKLELEDENSLDFEAIARQLRQIRIDRRKAKDALTVTRPVKDRIDKNQPFVRGLEQLLGFCRKAEKKLENRVYVARVARRC